MTEVRICAYPDLQCRRGCHTTCLAARRATPAQEAGVVVKRLRALVIMDEVGSDNPLGREAANLIESLTARNAALTDAGEFLADRLDYFNKEISADSDAMEWDGHVAPALARFRAALAPT